MTRLSTRIAALLILIILGCAQPSRLGTRDIYVGGKKTKVSQIELQQDLERFTSEFMGRVVQESERLIRDNPSIERPVIRQTLLYTTAALDIATETFPEIGLLDMLVFIALSRGTLEAYWIPEVFGPDAKGLLDAFRRSEEDLGQIASKVLGPRQKAELETLIEQWKERNPDQIRVEEIRLADFSRFAGKIARSQDPSSGLLSSVSAAVDAADSAVLLGDRAMYLAQRMPFLFRLHARLATLDALSDVGNRLQEADGLDPLLSKSSDLAQKAGIAARASLEFSKSLYPLLLPKDGTFTRNLDRVDAMADKTLAILTELQSLRSWHGEIDAFIRRCLIYLLILGAGWSIFFWGGYYFYKRAYLRASLRESRDRRERPRRAA